MSNRIIRTCLLSVLVACWMLPAMAGAASQDDDFLAAREAFRVGDAAKLERAARSLAGYPLEPYVNYWRFRLRIDEATPDAVRAMLAPTNRETPSMRPLPSLLVLALTLMAAAPAALAQSIACSPHASPGCGDGACEAAVCPLDPFCCATEWDQRCATEASVLCAACHPPAGCTLPPATVEETESAGASVPACVKVAVQTFASLVAARLVSVPPAIVTMNKVT